MTSTTELGRSLWSALRALDGSRNTSGSGERPSARGDEVPPLVKTSSWSWEVLAATTSGNEVPSLEEATGWCWSTAASWNEVPSLVQAGEAAASRGWKATSGKSSTWSA